MPKGFNENDLFALKQGATELRENADKQIEEGNLVVHDGLILPKEYKLGSKHEILVQPLNYEIEPGMFVHFNAYIFKTFTDNGPLVDNFACQGLMYYAIKTFKLFYDRTENLSYDDDPDLAIDYRNIFKTTAMQYCVTPEAMAGYWPRVSEAFEMMFGWEVPPAVRRGTQKILHNYAE